MRAGEVQLRSQEDTSERSERREPSTPRLLWIKADQLHPLNSGGRIRTYNMLKELKAHFHVSYFCLGDDSPAGLQSMSDYSHEQYVVRAHSDNDSSLREAGRLLLSLSTSRLPFVIHKYTSRKIRESLGALIVAGGFDVIVCDFLSMSANLLPLPRLPGARYVVFQHNVESRIWERHYRTAERLPWRLLYQLQWKRFLKFEEDTCRWFDGVIAVSEADARDFKHDFSLPNVLGHVETGVDIEYFAPRHTQPDGHDIVFLGSMDWTPNIDGIVDFVRECWPSIKRRIPDATLTIVGRNPAPPVTRLAQQDSSITVTGTVDDVRPYLARAALSVVPLRVGGGTRIKIYEAMAMGVPVVSTEVGAEGLPVVHRKHVMLASDWDSLTNCTTELLEDRELATQIAHNGAQLVRANYSWQVITGDFIDMLQPATAGENPASTAPETSPGVI
jgi:glycosyltransferase involved in cell wall biosynthesis